MEMKCFESGFGVLREQGVDSSNLVIPTIQNKGSRLPPEPFFVVTFQNVTKNVTKLFCNADL